MGKVDFHTLPQYKELQRERALAAWRQRIKVFVHKRETRNCARPDCDVVFTLPTSDPKRYCSRTCSAKVNNVQRGNLSEATKKKIGASLKGTPSPYKGAIKVPRNEIACQNLGCGKKFLAERWRNVKYCSNACSMKIIGGKPTSPRASRGKAGVRLDISPTIYFYSRWEANVARLYTHLGIAWQYAPKTFDIGGQKYTPDFYLPESDTYVEVKNFWWKYSIDRDAKFRKQYRGIKLHVLLKEEYLKLEKQYAPLIPDWEFKNSPFQKS